MRTNIVLDDVLVSEAMRLGGVRTKRAAVHLALEHFVQEKKRLDLRELRGRIRFRKGYDPHETRTR
jgi:Arc/MetJ family transcription regulator